VVRHRIALSWLPGLAFAGVIVTSWGRLQNDRLGVAVGAAGYLLVIAASMGRIWCAIFIAGRKQKELCTDGPYSLCRNPLYLFSFFGVLGLALAAKNVGLALVVTPLFWGYYALVIRSEEKMLVHRFGEAFEEYRRVVPAVWPRFSGYRSRETFVIRPRKVLTGMVDAMWFLWALLLLQVLEQVKALVPHR
jgi:protein-S-isoprenylcysteine O-methyltransferase Ste14